MGEQDAERGTVRVVFGIQKPGFVEKGDGLRVVLVFKGRPTEPEVGLRSGSGVRVTPEHLMKSSCHLGVFLELTKCEGFLQEGYLDLLAELETGDDLLKVGERLAVALSFLPSETSLKDSGGSEFVARVFLGERRVSPNGARACRGRRSAAQA